MTPTAVQGETFREFVNSFAYGSRTDLNFKFLKELSDEEAARFFQELLWKLGDTLDDSQAVRLIDHIYAWQVRGYAAKTTWAFDDAPFTPLRKPVAHTRLVLISSSGFYVEGQDPEPLGVKDMSQVEAIRRIGEFLKCAPTLTAIPKDTPRERVRVRHGGYDIRGAERDPNVVFPLERMLELEREGVIGELAPDAYTFVGATAQTQLLKHAGPEWAALLKQQEIDAALLVPG